MNIIKLSLIFIAIVIMTAGLAGANDIWNETPDIWDETSEVNSERNSATPSFSGNQQPRIDIWAETPDRKTQDRVYDNVSDPERVRTCAANPELYKKTPDVNSLVLAGSYFGPACN